MTDNLRVDFTFQYFFISYINLTPEFYMCTVYGIDPKCSAVHYNINPATIVVEFKKKNFTVLLFLEISQYYYLLINNL